MHRRQARRMGSWTLIWWACILSPDAAGADEDSLANDIGALIRAFDVYPAAQAAWDEAMRWSTETDACGIARSGAAWTGVSCTNRRVTKVDLHLVEAKTALRFSLRGTVGRLSELDYLSTSGTGMSGTIPPELSKCTKLTRLYLHTVRGLSGTIPHEVAEMSSMVRLSLYDSSLSGTVPPSMGDMPSLLGAYLSGTRISGTVPMWSTSTSKLEVLQLESPISGTMPTAISGQLQRLSLTGTSLSGSLPSSVGTLAALEYLFFFDAKLSGSLPDTLGNLDVLRILDVHNNKLTGLSKTLTKCDTLQVLDASHNLLPKLPASLPSTLTHVYLHGNPLNMTVSMLSEVLATAPEIHALDVAVTNVPIVLAWSEFDPPRCNSRSWLGRGCSGTRVIIPSGCRLGHDALPCELILQMYDADDQPALGGGVINNLTLRYNENTTAMVDNRDGTFSAIVPQGWLRRKGSHTFQFFHEDQEFTPFLTAGNAYGSDPDCRSPTFGPCASARTVFFAERQCPRNTFADKTGLNCICASGFLPNVGFSQMDPQCHLDCPYHTVQSEDGSYCECDAYTYNTTAVGVVVCARQWSDPTLIPEYQAVQRDAARGIECSLCPTACASCNDGDLAVREGWRPTGDRLSKPGAGMPRFVLQCPNNGSNCPYFALNGQSVAQNGSCARNHVGALCAVCLPGFSDKGSNDNECRKCGDVNSYALGVSIEAFVIMILCGFSAISALLYSQRILLRRYRSEVFTNARILIGAAQVLSLASGVLNLVYPGQARASLAVASLVAVDLGSLLNFQCLGFDWHLKWRLIVGSPAILGAVVLMRWTYLQLHVSGSVARAKAVNTETVRSMLFMCTLLYPQVATAIFSAVRCRRLDEHVWVLEVDYSVSCNYDDTRYYSYRIVALVLVCVWNVGVPLGLFLLLMVQYRKNQKLWFQVAALKERTQSPASDDVISPSTNAATFGDVSFGEVLDDSTSLEVYNYVRIREIFGFCVDDYKPGRFWYEPVDIVRKLALSGLLDFVQEGSAEQVFCGCGLAFISFGGQLALRPYKQPQANFLKALVDAQIFLTFLISFILRVMPHIDSTEPTDDEFYAGLLIASMLLLCMVAVVLTLYQVRRKHLFSQGLRSASQSSFVAGPRSERFSTLSENFASEMTYSGADMAAAMASVTTSVSPRLRAEDKPGDTREHGLHSA